MMARSLFGLVLALLCAAPAAAQGVWLAGGIGAALPTSGGDAIANMFQLNYQAPPHHVALRAVVLHDMQAPDVDAGTDMIAEVGLLYGRMRTSGSRHLAVATGVSGIGFDACPDDDDSCFTIGLPLVAEAGISGRFAGVGLQAYGNLNSKASYVGAALFVRFGLRR